jgi:hypothetical protein
VPKSYEAVKASVGGDRAKASAIYVSAGKTEAEKKRRARLIRDYEGDEAMRAAKKRGIIGVRG